MNSIYPLIIPTLLGFFSLQIITRKTSLPNRWLFILVTSPIFGLAIISLLCFFSYLLMGVVAKTASYAISFWTVVLLIIIYLLQFNSTKLILLPNPKKSINAFFLKIKEKNKAHTILTIICILFFISILIFFTIKFWIYMSWNPLGGWDARYLWQTKARFIARDVEEWKLLFSLKVGWQNQDYPLLLPFAIAWGWIYLGTEALAWPMLINYFFLLSLCGVVAWYIHAYHCLKSALIAGALIFSIHAFRFWSTALYADVPLSFFLTTATLLSMIALREKQQKLFFLAGLSGGFAAWTKNEGLMFFSLILVTLIFLLRKDLFSFKKYGLKSIASYIIGAAAPLIAVIIVRKFLSEAGGSYLFNKETFWDFLKPLSDITRIQIISICFVLFKRSPEWQGLWYFFIAAVIFNLIFKKPNGNLPYQNMSLALIILVELGYFCIYLITPTEIKFQIQTTLIRTLLHTGALALIFSFETFNFKKPAVNK